MIRDEIRKRQRTAIDAAILFIILLLILQMWLLTATLESYLAGHTEAALPGVIISAIILGACLALYRFISRLDRTSSALDR